MRKLSDNAISLGHGWPPLLPPWCGPGACIHEHCLDAPLEVPGGGLRREVLAPLRSLSPPPLRPLSPPPALSPPPLRHQAVLCYLVRYWLDTGERLARLALIDTG